MFNVAPSVAVWYGCSCRFCDVEGQVPLGWNSGHIDAGLVSFGEVWLLFYDTAVQHLDARGGDSVRVVECGLSPPQVLVLDLVANSNYKTTSWE